MGPLEWFLLALVVLLLLGEKPPRHPRPVAQSCLQRPFRFPFRTS
jgi:hypothetical protein